MPITEKEIAALAGVSRGTVDRALKDRPGVSPETKARILAIAEKYDYRPNILGTALVRSGKTTLVPVILNSVGNPFFSSVKEGLLAAQNEFTEYGIQLALTEFKGYDPDELLNILNDLPADTKQLIVSPICDVRVEQKLQQLADSGVSVVMLTSRLESIKNAVYIGCDYLKSGRVAGRLVGLLSGGQANLFIVTGSVHHKGHAQRVDGIQCVLSKDYPGVRLLGVSENLDDDDVAYKAMQEALFKYPEIDFVYIIAGGVNGTLQALGEHDRHISVCAFDDTPMARKALVSGRILATICQQPYEQGYQAVKAVFEKVICRRPFSSDLYTELSIKVDESL